MAFFFLYFGGTHCRCLGSACGFTDDTRGYFTSLLMSTKIICIQPENKTAHFAGLSSADKSLKVKKCSKDTLKSFKKIFEYWIPEFIFTEIIWHQIVLFGLLSDWRSPAGRWLRNPLRFDEAIFFYWHSGQRGDAEARRIFNLMVGRLEVQWFEAWLISASPVSFPCFSSPGCTNGYRPLTSGGGGGGEEGNAGMD